MAGMSFSVTAILKQLGQQGVVLLPGMAVPATMMAAVSAPVIGGVLLFLKS